MSNFDVEMGILTVLGPYDMDAQQTLFAQEFQINISGVLLPSFENAQLLLMLQCPDVRAGLNAEPVPNFTGLGLPAPEFGITGEAFSLRAW